MARCHGHALNRFKLRCGPGQALDGRWPSEQQQAVAGSHPERIPSASDGRCPSDALTRTTAMRGAHGTRCCCCCCCSWRGWPPPAVASHGPAAWYKTYINLSHDDVQYIPGIHLLKTFWEISVPVTLRYGHGIYQVYTWFILGIYHVHTVT